MAGARKYRFALGVVGVVGSAVFVYLAVRRLDFAATKQVWRDATPLPWVAFGVLSYVAGHLVRGLRLRTLIRKEATLPWLTATNVVVIGYASNNVFPARLGELVRAGVLVERTGMPMGEALTITFIERLLDGLAILLLLLGSIFFITPTPSIMDLARVGSLVFGGALATVLVGVLAPNALLGLASTLSAPLGAKRRDAVLRITTHVINGGSCLRNVRTATVVSLLSVLVWILEAGLFACILPAFAMPIRFSVGSLAMSVTNLGILVPSTPGYVGPFHFFCSRALESQGTASATALGYAVLVHIAFYVPITLWGAIAMLRYGVEVGATAAAARSARSAPTEQDVEGVPVHFIAHVEPARPISDVSELSIALAETLLPPCPTETLRDVARFMDGQVGALPPRLRTMFHLGMTFFRAMVRLRYVSSFCALPLARRRAIVEAWAFGRFALLRQLFRPVRSVVLLAYYERADVAQTLGPSLKVVEEQRAPPDPIDVLVIGSGAGGAVTAHELASAGRGVVVLEEGSKHEVGDYGQGSVVAMEQLYRRRGMTPIIGRVPIGYVEGACLGGSTEINSGFWHRTPREVLLRYKSQFDLADASPDELAPHFEWAEKQLHVGLHGAPWPKSTAVFSRGIEAMGWAAQEVPRAAQGCVNTNQCAAGCPKGAKQGMSREILPRAKERGARILTRCRARLLLTRARRVTGVLAELEREPGKREMVRFDAEHVFVCAGPTETPALLRRSGIKYHVGDTLRIHPMLKVVARFPERIDAQESVLPLLQVKEFWPEMSMGGGFFTPGHLAMMLSDNWLETREQMKGYRNMAAYYVAVRGTGNGSVRPSLLGDTGTHLRYDVSEEDLIHLSKGLARLATLLLAAGATEVYPTVQGVPIIRTELEAIRWLDERLPRAGLSLTTVHAFSSCPIGERIDRCAANSFGKVHRCDNLYVGDASMVPDSPGVNPQGTVMALARRNALHFSEARS